MDVYRNMIVKSEYVELARFLCETLAPVGGANMFTTALASINGNIITHYISSGFIDEEFANLMPLKETDSLGQAEMIVALMDALGHEVSLEAVTTLLSTSDVCLENPFEAMGRLGLKILQAEGI